MSASACELSIEELAVALGLVGGAALTQDVLRAAIGERPDAELEGRLIAAGHSLLARGSLQLDEESRALDPTLLRLVAPLIRNTFSLRCGRSGGTGEQVVQYFRGEERLVRLDVQHVVACRLEEVADYRALRNQLLAFFEQPLDDEEGPTAEPLTTIPAELLEMAKTNSRQHRDGTVALFAQAGLATPIARDLAVDFAAPASRGSVVRIESHGGRFVSNCGVLTLQGAQRWWLFEILLNNPTLLNVHLGTSSQFDGLLRALAH